MPVDIIIPTVGESVTSGVIASWVKKDGEYVNRDETVLELETDKVTMEVPAPASGVIRHGAKAGDEVKVGASVGSIDESAAAPAASAGTKAAAVGASKPQSGGSTAVMDPPAAQGEATSSSSRATPLAQKTASQLGVDLTGVSGTGVGHKIREQDVLAAHMSKRPVQGTNGSAHASAPSGPRSATREKLSKLRERVAERLIQAQHNAAMLTTFNECDMTNVMALRKQYKEQFEKKHGVGLGFMSFFVKAVVKALREVPMVNAFLVRDESGAMMIERHDYADISIAVASPKGLVVPILRDAHLMSFSQIESTIKSLAVKAQDGKLTIDEMTGGTFTITNGGVFGSLMSTPIVNAPQSAILGMHKIQERPIVADGAVVVRPMMYLALTYDHRIIDGREAVQFLVAVKEMLEDPSRLLLQV